MRTPVVLPSYVRTVLEAQRARADKTTLTMSVITHARRNAGAQVRPKTWIANLLRGLFHAAVAVQRRVFANGRSGSG